MLRRTRIVMTVLLTVAALLMAGTNPVSASSPIGPHQHFLGLVNGKHSDAVIYTACPGPELSGERGPVVSGQTVAAKRVRTGGGNTGQGGPVIYARITPTTIVSITAYRQSEPIPNTAQVPCQGQGTVVFSTCPLPAPCGAGARVDAVAVQFINIAT